MEAHDPQGDSVEVPLSWIGLDELPILFANQFIIQHQPNEFIFTVGQMAPPALLGPPEVVAEQAREITHIPVKPLARIGMTRHRLAELIAVLQANLENHDRKMREMDPLDDSP